MGKSSTTRNHRSANDNKKCAAAGVRSGNDYHPPRDRAGPDRQARMEAPPEIFLTRPSDPARIRNAVVDHQRHHGDITRSRWLPGLQLRETEDLVAAFDKNVRDARKAIESAKDPDYQVTWSLKRGDQVFFSAPRAVIVRQTINHLVHHRGQLTVYLRLIDVPVPSIYGPTADEKWPGM